MSAIILKILTFPNRPAYRLLCIINKTLYINFPKYLLVSLSRLDITSIKLRHQLTILYYKLIYHIHAINYVPLPTMLLLYGISFLSKKWWRVNIFLRFFFLLLFLFYFICIYFLSSRISLSHYIYYYTSVSVSLSSIISRVSLVFPRYL